MYTNNCICVRKWEKVLLGTYEHSLDSKNRLTLPAAIRKQLGTQVMITIGVDKCMELRTPEEFNEYANTLKNIGSTKSKYRMLQRAILGNTFEVQIDSANRVLLPSTLIKATNVKKNVVLIGVGDKVEIWDADIYTSQKRDDDINALSAVLEGLDDYDD